MQRKPRLCRKCRAVDCYDRGKETTPSAGVGGTASRDALRRFALGERAIPALVIDQRRARAVMLGKAQHAADQDVMVARRLRELGFLRATALDGGMAAWREAGRAIET